jgi:hypothetical protein
MIASAMLGQIARQHSNGAEMRQSKLSWVLLTIALINLTHTGLAMGAETAYVKASRACRDAVSRDHSNYLLIAKTIPGAKAVLAMSDNYQTLTGGTSAGESVKYVARYCGWATNYLAESQSVDESMTWAELERQAVAACLEDRGHSGAPCQVVAHNDDIIYSTRDKNIGTLIAGGVPGRTAPSDKAENPPPDQR